MNRKPPHAVLSDDRRTPGGAALVPVDDLAQPSGAGPLIRRSFLAMLLVALWCGIGFAMHLQQAAYLLIGIPLAPVFQRWIAGKPMRAAWIFDAGRLRWGWPTWLAGLVLAAGPSWLMSSEFRSRSGQPLDALYVLWCLAAVVGVFLGVATVRARSGAAFLRVIPFMIACFITSTLPLTYEKISLHAGRLELPSAHMSLALALATVPTLFGIAFLSEEVTFRGMLDPYLRAVARGPTQEFASALVGSALWGAWHLPIMNEVVQPDPGNVMRLFALHIGVGVPLCYLARLSGTLAPSSIVHALVDTTRDAFP